MFSFSNNSTSFPPQAALNPLDPEKLNEFRRGAHCHLTGVSVTHQQPVHWKHCSSWESVQVQVSGLEQPVQWSDPHLLIWVCGFLLHVAQPEPALRSIDCEGRSDYQGGGTQLQSAGSKCLLSWLVLRSCT